MLEKQRLGHLLQSRFTISEILTRIRLRDAAENYCEDWAPFDCDSHQDNSDRTAVSCVRKTRYVGKLHIVSSYFIPIHPHDKIDTNIQLNISWKKNKFNQKFVKEKFQELEIKKGKSGLFEMTPSLFKNESCNLHDWSSNIPVNDGAFGYCASNTSANKIASARSKRRMMTEVKVRNRVRVGVHEREFLSRFYECNNERCILDNR